MTLCQITLNLISVSIWKVSRFWNISVIFISGHVRVEIKKLNLGFRMLILKKSRHLKDCCHWIIPVSKRWICLFFFLVGGEAEIRMKINTQSKSNAIVSTKDQIKWTSKNDFTPFSFFIQRNREILLICYLTVLSKWSQVQISAMKSLNSQNSWKAKWVNRILKDNSARNSLLLWRQTVTEITHKFLFVCFDKR